MMAYSVGWHRIEPIFLKRCECRLLVTGRLGNHGPVSSPSGQSGRQGEDLGCALKETLAESGLASPPLPSGGQA